MIRPSRSIMKITEDCYVTLVRPEPDPFALEQTNRGFNIATFDDAYGKECSLQESSSCDPHVWLGICKPDIIKDLTTGPGVPVVLGEDYHVFGRMHLNQEHVKQLLPHLTHFAEKGYLA